MADGTFGTWHGFLGFAGGSTLLKQVSAHIEVGTVLKYMDERGERYLKRVQVIKLTQILKEFEDEFVYLWTFDKMIEVICEDTLAA